MCVTEKEQASAKACKSRAPSLAETEEALAQAVWCWAGVSRSVLVHEDNEVCLVFISF